jgi:hypothetical protein
VERTIKKCERKKGIRESDKGKEERERRIKMRDRSFPVEFKLAFNNSTRSK